MPLYNCASFSELYVKVLDMLVYRGIKLKHDSLWLICVGLMETETSCGVLMICIFVINGSICKKQKSNESDLYFHESTLICIVKINSMRIFPSTLYICNMIYTCISYISDLVILIFLVLNVRLHYYIFSIIWSTFRLSIWFHIKYLDIDSYLY